MLKAAWQVCVIGRLQNLTCCWMLPLPLIYFLGKKVSCNISWFNYFQCSYLTDILHGQEVQCTQCAQLMQLLLNAKSTNTTHSKYPLPSSNSTKILNSNSCRSQSHQRLEGCLFPPTFVCIGNSLWGFWDISSIPGNTLIQSRTAHE